MRFVDSIEPAGEMETVCIQVAAADSLYVTEDFLVTREFREIATEEQRFHLLRCLFAVAVADASISSEEEAQLWQTAGELGFTRAEFTAIRREFSGHRSILQRE